MIAVLCSLILWPIMWALSAVLWVIGIPVCAWLAYTRNWSPTYSYLHPERTIYTWPAWAWIWSNDEDGVKGSKEWQETHSERWGAFLWTAIRNPSNNLRFVPFLNPIIDAKRIGYWGNVDDPNPRYSIEDNPLGLLWAFTWQLPFAGLIVRYQWATRHCQIRLGWKLLPRDKFGVPDWDYRKNRCGFGTQLHLWREG